MNLLSSPARNATPFADAPTKLTKDVSDDISNDLLEYILNRRRARKLAETARVTALQPCVQSVRQ
jgi:hypothetical protein